MGSIRRHHQRRYRRLIASGTSFRDAPPGADPESGDEGPDSGFALPPSLFELWRTSRAPPNDHKAGSPLLGRFLFWHAPNGVAITRLGPHFPCEASGSVHLP